MPNQEQPPVIQIVGYKNSGKTTLLCALIGRFRADGLNVAAIKHDAHDFTLDAPGTDTWKLARAGAEFVAIASPHRAAWMMSRPAELDEMIGWAGHADLILVEGFKQAPYPKLILLRNSGDLPLLDLPNAAAAVTPQQWAPPPAGLPCFSRDDIAGIHTFIRTLIR